MIIAALIPQSASLLCKGRLGTLPRQYAKLNMKRIGAYGACRFSRGEAVSRWPQRGIC